MFYYETAILFAILILCPICSSAKRVIKISDLDIPKDSKTDVSCEINDLLAKVSGKNFVIEFDCDYDYAIGTKDRFATIYVGSNTTIRFTGKGYLKLQSPSENGSVVLISGCKNVVIDNVQIDGGGQEVILGNSGQNGIGISNSTNIRIKGGIIKNCAKGKDVCIGDKCLLGDGGKGIQVENYGVNACVIEGVTILNCNKAISCHRDMSQRGAINVVFRNIVAKGCNQFAIIHQTNGEDRKGNEQKVIIEKFMVENCGNEDGVFIFSRTRYLMVRNGIVKGTERVPAIFRGRASHTTLSNITVDQPCLSVVDLNPSAYGCDERETRDNKYGLTILSSYDYLISSDTDRRFPNREMLNSVMVCKTKERPRVAVYTDQVVNSGSDVIKLIYENGKGFVLNNKK